MMILFERFVWRTDIFCLQVLVEGRKDSVTSLFYLLHFTLNTTPPPGRISLPNRAADVAIVSSGE